METIHVTALMGALAAGAAVSSTIDPDLFLDAEKESKQVIEQYDQRKTKEYDQICELVKGCVKEGKRYVL